LGTVPPKFEVGTPHAFVPPIFGEVVFNISICTVIACEAKYEFARKK